MFQLEENKKTSVPAHNGAAVSDAELDALKAEYRAKIAAMDAAIAQYENLLHSLQDVAKESTSQDIFTALQTLAGGGTLTSVVEALQGLDTETLTSIKSAVTSIVIPNDYAKEATLTNSTDGLGAIKQAVDAIPTTAPATPTNVSDALAAIIDAIQANAGVPTLTIPSTTASQELAPNTLYVFAERTTDLTLTLGTPIVGIANEYHLFLIVGSTAPTITWPTGITWNGGSAPTIAADKTYEVSILNNVAAYFEV